MLGVGGVAPVPLVPAPQFRGWLLGSTVNAGRVSVEPPAVEKAPSQSSVACSIPVLPKAFETHTYAGRPVKTPMPPRTVVFPLPCTS